MQPEMQTPVSQMHGGVPHVVQLLVSSLTGGGQTADPLDESHAGSSVHALPSSQTTPVHASMQVPVASQVPVPPLHAVPVLGEAEQVVTGGASQVFVVHSLPSSHEPSGLGCALQSAETQTPA